MTERLPATIPIFPLPDVVFYPRTALPLHIFESRYRQMVAEALEGDRILGIVMLKSGWEEDYFGSPLTYDVGCAGRIEDVVTLPDGRFTLRLDGLWKIEIVRYLRLEPYRLAEVRSLEEREPDPEGESVEDDKVRLLAAYTSVLAATAGRPATAFTLDASLEYTRLVNLACMHLGFEVEEKQRLLELHDVAERGRRITTMLEREWDRLLQQHRLQDGGEESVH